ncbi:hypothetical protein D3C80_1976000 [compost metagenome]
MLPAQIPTSGFPSMCTTWMARRSGSMTSSDPNGAIRLPFERAMVSFSVRASPRFSCATKSKPWISCSRRIRATLSSREPSSTTSSSTFG